MSSDDRYEVPEQHAVPEYLNNAFRNIDRHYKQRYINIRGQKKLEPTDYSSVLNLRNPQQASQDNLDSRRVITVATREKDKQSGDFKWKWQVEPCFNENWSFLPSLNQPVAGDGAPHKKTQQSSPPPLQTSSSLPTQEETITLTSIESISTSQPQQHSHQQPNKRFLNKKSHKNNQDQFIHPFQHYTPDYAGICGSSSSSILAVDQVPGLFIISRAIHYTSQLTWALRCFLSYEHDYTNLYNLHFVLPDKGVKEGLESLPDQTKLPDDLKVNQIADIQQLFIKACANTCKLHPKFTPLATTTSNSQEKDQSTCLHCKDADSFNFYVHSHHYQQQSKQHTEYQIPSLSSPQSQFHVENDFNLASLKRLRWASLGYHYDWTDREYNDHNKDPFPLELFTISQSIIQPLVDHGLVSPLIPEAGIINYYPIGSRMGAHMDDAELAVECPIVSFSIGLTSLFVIGNQNRIDEPVQLFLRSGDCLIQDGISRLAYHAVPRIIEDSLPFVPLYQAACSLLDHYYCFLDLSTSSLEQSETTQEMKTRLVKEITDSAPFTRPLSSAHCSDHDPTTLPHFVPEETLSHFIELVIESTPLLQQYNVTLEQLLTFLLHILCEYRINFNTRQVQDPKLGSSLTDVRQSLRNRQEQLQLEKSQAKLALE